MQNYQYAENQAAREPEEGLYPGQDCAGDVQADRSQAQSPANESSEGDRCTDSVEEAAWALIYPRIRPLVDWINGPYKAELDAKRKIATKQRNDKRKGIPLTQNQRIVSNLRCRLGAALRAGNARKSGKTHERRRGQEDCKAIARAKGCN